jgi:hypothetical protein
MDTPAIKKHKAAIGIFLERPSRSRPIRRRRAAGWCRSGHCVDAAVHGREGVPDTEPSLGRGACRVGQEDSGHPAAAFG